MKNPTKVEIENLENMTLGELCSILAEANIQIYKLENKKWWGRQEGNATDKEINDWDDVSRTWNEKRSMIKNQIDNVIRASLNSKSLDNTKMIKSDDKSGFSFQVLPISLMIDMLTIENIKIYDLTIKKNDAGVMKAKSRRDALQKNIDEGLKHIFSTNKYTQEGEARTF